MDTQAQTNKIHLRGVPETMLAPLYNRAWEQKRADRLIDDPLSLKIANSIDYDYEANFGKPMAWHAIRSRVFDDAIREWLKLYPNGTIVSLGEGLDTQFWRVDNGLLNWISVDLPESIEVRSCFLPANKRNKLISCSALDYKWSQHVPKDVPVFFVFGGLLMYFLEKEVGNLLFFIADNFPNSNLLFDMNTKFHSSKTLEGFYNTKKYTAPSMPWGLNYDKSDKLLSIHPKFIQKMKMTFFDVFPERLRPYSFIRHVAWLNDRLSPWMIQLSVSK
ncbi:MAG: class I SAM-dependent methyltransferase [bacterium]